MGSSITTAANSMLMHHLPSICLSPNHSKSSPSSTIFSSSSPTQCCLLKTAPNPNLKPLTSRILRLTRRRELQQIFKEVETAKKRYGSLNTIVMNAVMEACIHCGDIDAALQVFRDMSTPQSCGVDGVTYGTLLKGLGQARRIDEAFQILESLEQGTAAGSPQLSAPIIIGLLTALVQAGDLRRANGLLARHGFLLREGSTPSILIYNILMKGYINIGCPLAALSVQDEIVRLGLIPDRVTYNTLIFASVMTEKLDTAMHFLEEMKEKTQKQNINSLYPDVVTYTTLLKGFGHAKDLFSVKTIVLEMKLRRDIVIDRTAFTATVDALLYCGSTKDALCIFGEIIKRAGINPNIRPKPHLYLSMMRAFAIQGDYNMVKNFNKRMWPDSAGTITTAMQEEADHLLMEAALNSGQIDLAMAELSHIREKWNGVSWTSRGGMVVMRMEALLGFKKSMFSPHLLPQVSPNEHIESIMIPIKEAKPLRGTLLLNQVVMRIFRDRVVPIVDEWGCCIGLLHREDCIKLDAPLMTMVRSPPPCVTTKTSIGHVIDLILRNKHQMVVVVKYSDVNGGTTGNISSCRAVGVFTVEHLFKLIEEPQEEEVLGHEPTPCRTQNIPILV